MLSPRSDTILKFIVDDYIAKAIPVPSETVAQDTQLGVCSATIRNEMAHLEQEGLIIRPYASSGSIPSDKGYRYYVETLVQPELPEAEQHLISHLFHQVEKEQEAWIHLAATIVARFSNNMAIVTNPRTADSRFKHLELVELHELTVLMVLVLHGAVVRQQLMSFDQIITQEQLTSISNKLNSAYAGLSRTQIMIKGVVLSPAEQEITDIIARIMQAEDEQGQEEACIDGWHFMLNQPEFTQGQQLLALMELVERRSLLKAILPQHMPARKVTVIIGNENRSDAIRDYSVVLSHYGLPEEATGTLGVVGPTRMAYHRVIPTIGYLSSVLSSLVAELYGRSSSHEATPE